MTIHDLLNQVPQTGEVRWIGLRPAKRAAVQVVESVRVNVENGLEGDHYSSQRSKRQVTLIQAEHIAATAQLLQHDEIDPILLRRNIVVSGINLLALKEHRFRIGEEVILETTGKCHPCSRMEENLGPGGYHAMVGHGGITTKVIQGGTIRKGDKVVLIPSEKLVASR
ncbi:MAG: MOSC domain-containing protein [Bacteroidota bacterium]